jgi:hypothetical protein
MGTLFRERIINSLTEPTLLEMSGNLPEFRTLELPRNGLVRGIVSFINCTPQDSL